MLNALTTCAPAGAALAISCAPELPSGVTKPWKSGETGLVMSMMTLPCSASPYSFTTDAALAYGTARITMSPAGAAPAVPAVAPSSVAANSLALAGSRPMISTALPPASARSAKVLAMFPRPIMLMLLIGVPAFWSRIKRHATPVVVNGRVVDAVERRDGRRSIPDVVVLGLGPGPAIKFRCRILISNSFRSRQVPI